MTGIFLLDKPEGWTSHDAVAKARRAFCEKRIGHGGTLDPMATGVLPLFLGRATRAVEFMETADKMYLAGIRPGIITDTLDTTGETLETRPAPDVGELKKILSSLLPSFLGERQQLPPMYSAKKVDGKKLYEYARAGRQVERKPSAIRIDSIEIVDGENEIRIRVRCSKGTYIRVLVDEIGRAVGCGAAMSSLVREGFGAYTLEGCRTMPGLLEAARNGEAEELLLPVDSVFSRFPMLTIDDAGEKKCRCGADVPFSGEEKGKVRVYSESGEFLMLGEAEPDSGILRTVKSFFEV